jgi:CBS domain containing-hemolysin-like protein
MLTPILVIAALILLNAIFVAAEFAIVGAPRAAIEAGARTNRLARLVQSVLRDPARQDRYIATAQIGVTVASLGLGMYGEHVISDALLGFFQGSTWAEWLAAHGAASVLAVAVLTYFHIVLGEMVPKSLALQSAEKMALYITPPMLWVQAILYPFVVTLNAMGNAVLRAMGIRRQAQGVEQFYTPE